MKATEKVTWLEGKLDALENELGELKEEVKEGLVDGEFGHNRDGHLTVLEDETKEALFYISVKLHSLHNLYFNCNCN